MSSRVHRGGPLPTHHHCWLAVSVFSLDPSVSVRFRRGGPSGDGACGPHDAPGARAAWLTECVIQHSLVECCWCVVDCHKLMASSLCPLSPTPPSPLASSLPPCLPLCHHTFTRITTWPLACCPSYHIASAFHTSLPCLTTSVLAGDTKRYALDLPMGVATEYARSGDSVAGVAAVGSAPILRPQPTSSTVTTVMITASLCPCSARSCVVISLTDSPTRLLTHFSLFWQALPQISRPEALEAAWW